LNSTRRSSRRDGLVLAIYFLLALALTYPLATHLTTHVSGQGVDDPAQTWSLWWVKFSLLNLGASPLATDYLFYPVGINLVAYTPTFLNGVLSIPLQLVSSVIVAQNLLVYFVLVGGGYGTFLLAREVLARHGLASDLAAALAGAVYAFGAWHIQYADATYMLLSNEWLPFYVLYLVRLDRGRWRDGALAGLFLVLTAWTELTFVLFLAIFTALYVCYLVIGRGFSRINTDKKRVSFEFIRVNPRPLVSLIILAAIGLIGMSPLALNLLADTQRFGYYLAAGMGRVQIFSAEPISFFVPSPQHPLLGAWASSITQANTRYAFIGYAVLLLAGLGLYFQRAAGQVRFWAIAAFFFALVMLGPTLLIAGQNTGIPLPFAVLRAIPFVNANRYPVRFNVVLMLALTPLVAFGAAHLLRARRGALLAGLVLLFAFEQLVIPIPLSDLRVPAIYQTIRDEPGDFAVLELPLGWRGSAALQGKMQDQTQFFQTVHQKRLLGGITSRTPAFKFQYFLEAPVINSFIALETGREIDDGQWSRDRALAPAVLRFFNIRYVDVNRALADPRLQQYALDVLPLQEIYRDETRILYRVAPLQPLSGAIRLDDETARLYFDDRWGRVQFSADGTPLRWAAAENAGLWLPLARRDAQITFRWHGAHANQKVAVQVNGQTVANAILADSWTDYTLRLPAELVRDGLNEILFVSDTTPLAGPGQDGTLAAEERTGAREEYCIGDTGVLSPVDIRVTGAGFDAGRFGEIFVAGENRIPNQRGYHLVALRPADGRVERVGSFDTFGDPNESVRLAQFVAELPPGEIVAGAAIDDVSRNLQPAAVDALAQLGVEGDLRLQFRMGQAFVGVKGASPGQALERVDGRWPANVSVGKNVAGNRASVAVGGVTTDDR
jgi:hypothetical protein